MIVKLYQIGKRENSTQQPVVGDPTYEISSCYLKEDCSVMRPVIRVAWAVNAAVSIHAYNYAYIPLFQRYYWVRDWVNLNNGMWEGDLEVDVLASFKTKIGLETHYVARADDDQLADGDISDSLYPTKIQPSYVWADIASPYQKTLSDGVYVIGVIGSENTEGVVSYYGFTAAGMGALKHYLLGTPDYMQTIPVSQGGIWDLDVTEATAKALFNPFQYITSAMWFPFTALQMGWTSTYQKSYIDIGWWRISGITCYAIPYKDRDFAMNSCTIHCAPGATGTDAGGTEYLDSKFRYLNYAPFAQYHVHYPPFGDFDLNPALIGRKFVSSTTYTIYFRAHVDLITGQAYFYTADMNLDQGVTTWTHNGIAEISGQLGVPVQLGQITANIGAGDITRMEGMLSMGTNILSAGMSAGQPGGLTGFIGSVISAPVNMLSTYYNATAASMPVAQHSGTQGGLAAFNSDIYIMCIYYNTVDKDPDERGYPIAKKLQINTLSGYIACANADPKIAGATLEELHQIKAFLDGGFFYE